MDIFWALDFAGAGREKTSQPSWTTRRMLAAACERAGASEAERRTHDCGLWVGRKRAKRNVRASQRGERFGGRGRKGLLVWVRGVDRVEGQSLLVKTPWKSKLVEGNVGLVNPVNF